MDDAVLQARASQGGLTVSGIHADGAVMLSFDLDQALTPGLAGFAIQCTPPAGAGSPYYLSNRITFTNPVTNQTGAGQLPITPSNQAPFQKFRWVYFPRATTDGLYTYTVTAMYFDPAGGLKAGPATSIALPTSLIQNGPLQVGFTRGFLTSQAYADLFHNAPYAPPQPRGISFDTTPYQAQYQWLGARARQMIDGFLSDIQDPSVSMDLFAYDLDEPDIINMLASMGSRLRAVLDDAPLHTNPGSPELLARAKFQQTAGNDHVVIGHFDRFSHSKVLIKKVNGVPVKVLAGSANFSIRGLYVQANNVFIFDDPTMAANYEQAFETAFSSMAKFRDNPISTQWYDLPAPGCPPYSVCFSPHKDSNLSIHRVADAIANAKSSVLFAVMELSGGGDVISDLVNLSSAPASNTASNIHTNLFTYGITQALGGIKLYKPGSTDAILTPFSALDNKVPPPFDKEWNGGMGQVIHHKFVVVDFNGEAPALFTGSSNLSAGGEADNGDNLVAIYDPVVVKAYAVEAIRLVDHYHFRTVQNQSTDDKPILLQGPVTDGSDWWRPYYDPTNIKCLERTLFAQ